MTKTNKLLLILALSMILMGASNVVVYYFNYGIVNVAYTVYVLIGLLFCFLLYVKLQIANWLLFIFFLAQVVVIYNPAYRYDFTTGLSVHFTYWTGSIDTPPNERFGFAFNFLSVFLMGLCIAGLGSTQKTDILENSDKAENT
ncbi:conserved membrane hypothetical protein [Vibrio nigripulchritudo SO65]|uniref:hypothetical protein n=1 Tax=Vibrio nigripulchritudo TaxID=28173 RepID=UPI0003B1C6E5|nr:hypothetical protein [Vibrio nigripulchritudo]CCN37508.1 conserved membrane hypothetical protein [Vibrio nigripulchritudo AM115]CCN41675.1 conserved membrane hypothetical protein [Vibrio nigripulchritudo FTn2]CCN63375.1 conserved membrane hypothetical protein [Vibrio nigripulchritudo POn4]CCN79439.1 conserved membrane hypothetical protein [Vibrio nigripulchritudo SO65]